jgi:prephenate dehydratase
VSASPGRRPSISFQGDLGSNSDEACRSHFPDHEPVPCASFEEAFEAVKQGRCDKAMIPVENSIAGRVADVHHLLPQSGLKIIGERFKPIHFQLMANRGVKIEDLRRVASMPIALGQCRRTLRRLGLTGEPAADTAGAARALAEAPDRTKAALAPALAAEIYGLDILLRDVEDETHNTTRFIVMSATADTPPQGVDCVTSFAFRVRNIPAALYKALGGFATNGVNMTKLESYMEGGAFTATFFFAEVDGRPDDPPLARALEEIGFFSDHFEILGVYPADPFRQTARARAGME